jgi:pyrroline-5-carboxylate reductase
MNSAKLAFLGAGNISGAIIRGLIGNGYDPACITAADPDNEQLSRLDETGIRKTNDNLEAIAHADVVLLCVKPNIVPALARSIAPHLVRRTPLVISVAAGVPATSLARWLGDECSLIRCMPNTPATIRQGASALYAARNVTAAQRDSAALILGAVGTCVWVDSDAQIDVVTAISGSGPAYFFYLMEAMEEAGTRLGLSAGVCRELVQQTALGAAMLVAVRGMPPAALRAAVTSPGGTTQAAIARMEELGFANLVDSAIDRAHGRAVEMAREYR